MTTAITKESLAARIAELESGARSLKEDYTLAAYKMLLATMEAVPVAQANEENIHAVSDLKAGYALGHADVAILRRIANPQRPGGDHATVPEVVELEKAKRCLPYHLDDRYKVNGSWIGSVQNYIVTLEQKLEENGINIDVDDGE